MAINPSIWYGDLPSHKRAAVRLALTATDLHKSASGGAADADRMEIVILLAESLQIRTHQAQDILDDPDTRVAALHDVLANR